MKKLLAVLASLSLLFYSIAVYAINFDPKIQRSGINVAPANGILDTYLVSSTKPYITTGSSKVATAKILYQKGNKWYYRITMHGKPGETTGVYTAPASQNPIQDYFVQVMDPNYTCDKRGTVQISDAAVLEFRVVSKSEPTVVYGTPGVVKCVEKYAQGRADGSAEYYLFRLATDRKQGATGVYINGKLAFTAQAVARPQNMEILVPQKEFSQNCLDEINRWRQEGTPVHAIPMSEDCLSVAEDRAKDYAEGKAVTIEDQSTLNVLYPEEYNDRAKFERIYKMKLTPNSNISDVLSQMDKGGTILGTVDFTDGAVGYYDKDGYRYVAFEFVLNSSSPLELQYY